LQLREKLQLNPGKMFWLIALHHIQIETIDVCHLRKTFIFFDVHLKQHAAHLDFFFQLLYFYLKLSISGNCHQFKNAIYQIGSKIFHFWKIQ